MQKTLIAMLVIGLLAMPVASAAPTAKASADKTTVKAGESVAFSAAASSVPSGDRIVSYQWSFGDGTSASGVRVSKNFTTNGVFKVTLTVIDSKGERATDTVNVTVLASQSTGTTITHTPITTATNGTALTVTVTLGGAPARGAEVFYKSGERFVSVAAKKGDGNTWTATIPATGVRPGLEYYVTATSTTGIAARAPEKAPETYKINVEDKKATPASPTPAVSPMPVDTPSPTPVVTPSPTPDTKPTGQVPGATEDADTPGFGLVLGIAALGAVAVLMRRRA